MNSGLLIHGKRDDVLNEEEYKRANDFIRGIKTFVASALVLDGVTEYRRNYIYVWVNQLLKLKMDNANQESIDALYYYEFGDLVVFLLLLTNYHKLMTRLTLFKIL